MTKTVIIHGHFYQPPRFSPWTGRIKREPSAFPANNWNDRILHECYKPNTCAGITSDNGYEEVNNFEHISFDMGPTLSGWMIREYIDVYRSILEADSASRNAVALPYNHTILPLDSEANLRAQIRWGIDEFTIRFGRRPAAMWLPECAVSSRVVEELIRNGMKFLILASGQAAEVKRLNGTQWYDVSGGDIDVRRPYRVVTDSGHIEVFFSHQGLAADISFNRLLDDPSRMADHIEKILGRKESEDTLVTIATDGETFGHHHKGAEKGLAYLLKYELPRRGIRVCNFEDYLRDHPVTWQVRLKEDSSWSCWHGVERWRGPCGCGTEEGSSLEWRAPLRESISWLGERILELARDKGSEFFTADFSEALEAYGEVLTTSTRLPAFRERYLREELRGDTRVDLLLEMVYFSFYSFTSCGWFFGSLDRPEPEQVLSFALRSMDLAEELFGVNLKEGFLSRLFQYPEAEKIWSKRVLALKISPEDIGRDFYDIYRYAGIKRLTVGFWYLEILEEEGCSLVSMENRRTFSSFRFEFY